MVMMKLLEPIVKKKKKKKKKKRKPHQNLHPLQNLRRTETFHLTLQNLWSALKILLKRLMSFDRLRLHAPFPYAKVSSAFAFLQRSVSLSLQFAHLSDIFSSSFLPVLQTILSPSR